MNTCQAPHLEMSLNRFTVAATELFSASEHNHCVLVGMRLWMMTVTLHRAFWTSADMDTEVFSCYTASAKWNFWRLGASSVYTIQPCISLQCHFIRSHMHWVHAVFSCNLPSAPLSEWPGLLHATAVTRGWNGYRNKNQNRKLTLENILPPLLCALVQYLFALVQYLCARDALVQYLCALVQYLFCCTGSVSVGTGSVSACTGSVSVCTCCTGMCAYSWTWWRVSKANIKKRYSTTSQHNYTFISAVSQSRDHKSGTLFRPPSKMCKLSDASKDTYRHSLAPSSSAKYLLSSSADFKRMLCLCVFVAVVFVLQNLHHNILG